MAVLPPFGEKTAWFAFKTTDVERVRNLVFGTEPFEAVDWETAVDESYQDPDDGFGMALVMPPIDGFILAASRAWLPWFIEGEMAVRCGEWAWDTQWEIQYYANERVIGAYGWGRVDEMSEFRHFAKGTYTLTRCEGTITPEERALAHEFLRDGARWGYEEETKSLTLDRVRDEILQARRDGEVQLLDGVMSPVGEIAKEELDVLAALVIAIRPDDVAGRWGIDPNQLDEREAWTASPTCWLGEIFAP
jgi:hypothetical protein